MRAARPIRVLFAAPLLIAAALSGAVSATGDPAPVAEASERGAGVAVVQAAPEPQTTTVFLVRHAEKAGPGDPQLAGAPANDPPLNAAGVTRAAELVRTLAGAGVTAIYSSPYERTRATVRPLADHLGLEVREHPAADFTGLVERVENTDAGGVVVIAGHSNTVPALVEALGAGPVNPIEEAWEYDNLYVVTVERPGEARVSVLKYGARSATRPPQ